MPNEKNKELKVTDKRMFTPEGDLREEYRFLNEKSTSTAQAEPAPRPEPPRAEPTRAAPHGEAPRRAPEPPPGPAAGLEYPEDYPEEPGELGGASFYDLVAMMAEPVPIYLGDARLPDGQSAANLEMARLHIDLLEVLHQKTAGNLTPQERAFLEDLLYRLRVRYVQKSR